MICVLWVMTQINYANGFVRLMHSKRLPALGYGIDLYLFANLDDVREATYWWRIEYNEERPHDSLGDRTPAEARLQAA